MKITLQSCISKLVVPITLFLLIGCSDKPSDSDIVKAVKTMLHKKVPSHIVEYWSDGYDAKIFRIEIKEWGDFNEKNKYWPVKLRISGVAKIDVYSIPPSIKYQRFDSISDFILFKDDYGKWRAKAVGSIFN